MFLLNAAYNRDQFVQLMGDFLPDFLKEEREFNIEDKSIKVTQLGKSKDLKLSILEFNIKEEDSAKRIATTQKAFKIMRRHSIRNSIIAFNYSDGDWRLSLLTSTLKLDENGKVISEESNPRRYSYLLGANAKTKTPYDFLIKKGCVSNFDDLLSRFSVEVVNKQFYNSIAELFMRLVGGKRDKTVYEGQLQIHGQVGPTQAKQEFAVRLIGRIVFCWFLKEKHSSNGTPLISDNLLSEAAVSGNSDYYHSILEPLFFGLLNTPINMRPESLRTDHFANIPYLNGGLFAPQETDFYNQNDFTGGGTPGLVTIPDSWFNELFEVFGQYNFTVDENTSYDVDLSIDPEMLGRIFENLLAEINPQTGETARKSTGSFYTPREIVDYMVDNSLLYYLKDKTNVSKSKLKAVISYGKEDDEEYPLGTDEKQQVVDALDELTILDPACGSGAFPIGILQKVVYILQQVDEDGKLWFEKQIKNIPSIDMQNDLKSKFQNENFDYIRKLGVIRQSVFGVDIQTIATEIAKLRCFLTLIIEEDINDSEPNRGVHPLPNLDFKFVTANSLINLPSEGKNTNNNQRSLLENTNHIAELKKIRDEYFAAPSDRRSYLRERFQSLQQDMFMTRIDRLAGNVTIKYDRLMRWKPFQNESSDWFSPEWMFGVEKFDIIIANPPYVHLENIKDEASRLYEPLNFKTYEKRGDLYALFFERGTSLLKEQGILTYITSNKWMRAGYGESLRNFFIENTHPIQLIDLGGGIFESATVDTDILILKKEPYFADTVAVAANKDLNAKNIAGFVAEQSVKIKFKENESWTILSPIEQSIKEKIERFGTPLKDWDIRINYGIKTGCNEAFIINEQTRAKLIAEDPKSAEIIRPILRGRDIKKNAYDFAGLYLIATHNGYTKENGTIVPRVDVESYPSIKRWLESEEWNDKPDKGTSIERLSSRTDKGDTIYNLRDCAYMDDFLQRKIIWSDIATEPNFVQTDEEIFFNNTCYMITHAPEWLVDYLNSNLIAWYFPKVLATDLGSGSRYFKQFVERIPVPKVCNLENLYYSLGLTDEEIKLISSSVRS